MIMITWFVQRTKKKKPQKVSRSFPFLVFQWERLRHGCFRADAWLCNNPICHCRFLSVIKRQSASLYALTHRQSCEITKDIQSRITCTCMGLLTVHYVQIWGMHVKDLIREDRSHKLLFVLNVKRSDWFNLIFSWQKKKCHRKRSSLP